MKKEMKSKKVVYILYFITILSLILGALVYKNIISPVSKIKASNQNILQTPRDIGGNLLSNPGFIFEDDNPNIPQVPGWYMFYGIGKPNQFQSGASPMIFDGPPGVPPLLGGSTPLITLKELAKDESSPIWDFQGVDGGSGYVINKPENAKNIANIFLYPYSASSAQQMLSFVVDTRESADKAHKNLAMGIAQSVNVTPGKTYRFGIRYYAPEDSTIEIRFYNGKRITGATDAVTTVDVNDSEFVWKDIYTQYTAPSNTATVSLRFLVPEGKYSAPSFKNVWMEEMQGGGSGGGESGTAQPVKVEYYKNGVQDTSASYTISAGILGRSFTVDNKVFSGYEFDYAMIGSSRVTSLPVVGYFSTSQQTVKMYYKQKVTDTYIFEVGNYDLGNQPVTMSKPTDSELKSWFASKSRVLKNGTIADNNIGASEISVAWVDTWAPSVGNKSYRVRVTYTSPTYNQQVVGQSVVANLNVNFQAAPTHNYNIRSDSTIDYGSVEVGSGPPAGTFYNGKVYLYDGNTKVKNLTQSSDFTVAYSPTWASQNTTAGPKTYTVTFRTTETLDGQYPGLSSNDTTTSTLRVTFTPKPWELKVTPVPHTYKTTDSQPTTAQRLGWVQAEIVSTANPPQPSLDASVNSVTITARESAPGSGNYISASTVDMSLIGTTKYRVTVSATGDGNTYTQTNVEVPITIEPGIIAGLKVKATTPQTAWTTDQPLTARASWVQAVITENDEEKQSVANPTVKITGREITGGNYVATEVVDMLLLGTTKYRVEVSTTYNGETLTATAEVPVTIKKLELKADAVGTESSPIVIAQNEEISDESYPDWVNNVRLEGQLLSSGNATVVPLRDNDQYSYSVTLKEGDTINTQEIGIQTVTLIVSAQTTINGEQEFGPIEVPATILIAGLGLEVPEELAFDEGQSDIYKKQLLNQSNPDWAIEVKDTRQGAQPDWKVYAKLTKNFQMEIDSQIREIKDILIYKDQKTDEGHLIDNENYQIFAGKGDLTKTWSEGAGFLLSIDAFKSLGIQEGNYSATIEFTLNDAP